MIHNSRNRIDRIHTLRKSQAGQVALAKLGRSVHGTMLGEFVGWDGEGVEQEPQKYVLFGSSTGHFVQGPNLTTVECLQTILEVERKQPTAIHVGFAFNYDVNMILRHVSPAQLNQLYKTTVCRWNGYRLEYIPSKYFQVSKQVEGKIICARIWDIFSFFQIRFTQALIDYLGDDIPGLQSIIEGKDQRKVFTYAELETLIKPYWKLELQYLVQIADKLRALLYEADIRITQWHGPGAVASALFKKYNTFVHMNQQLPDDILNAAQYACSAGRFELFQLGRANKRVYKTDINSAHPTTIARLPSLTNEWYHVIEPTDIEHFGLYHIEYNALEVAYQYQRNDIVLWPHPFHVRSRRGLIFYPAAMIGWRWSPEIKMAMQFLTEIGADFTITEGWVLNDDGTRPFAFVEEMYNHRKILKQQKNKLEKAFRLGPNSLYGKMAQRAGWRPGRKIPRSHQLEWAGYVTSGTRSLLWPALWQAYKKNALIACETDSVLSSEPLDLDYGPNLGQWDYEEYDDCIYLQNGIYLLCQDGKWKQKYRGLDNDSISYDDVMRFLERLDLRQPFSADWSTDNGPLEGTTTRFIGGRLALKTDLNKWRYWQTETRKIVVGTQGKRIHDPNFCTACLGDYIPPAEQTHSLIISMLAGIVDHQHHIPWRTSAHTAEPWPLVPDEVML